MTIPGTVHPGLMHYHKMNEILYPGTLRNHRGTLGAAANPPVFTDTSGNPITSIPCGGSFGFDVPGSGLTQIWLRQYKDGVKGYDGPFTIPMAAYASTCPADVGKYQNMVYDITTGVLLGQANFQVLPATGGAATGITSIFAGMSTTTMLLLAGGALLLLGGKKKR